MNKKHERRTVSSLVVRRVFDTTTEYCGQTISRRVIIFENKTDKELDVYVEMISKYADYYFKLATLPETYLSEYPLETIPEKAVCWIVELEKDPDFENTMQRLADNLCPKRQID